MVKTPGHATYSGRAYPRALMGAAARRSRIATVPMTDLDLGFAMASKTVAPTNRVQESHPPRGTALG